MDWNAILEEIRAERRQQLGEPPTVEDFLALQAGELSEEERRRVLEHASYDSAVARELLAVLRFPEPLDDDEDLAEDRAWAEDNLPVMREKLKAEGLWPVSAPVPAGARRWLPLAAMFLVGVLTAWVGSQLLWPQTWRQAGSSAGVRVNLPIVELLPATATASGVRGGFPNGVPDGAGTAKPVVLSAEASGLVLALLVPGLNSSAGDDYSLEIRRDDHSVTQLTGLAPGPGGVFVLDLPRHELAAGKIHLQLRDAVGAEVARYRFEVRWRD